MAIAFLGWGSLIWNPGNLRMGEEWYQDGPLLPVEFARISADKRLTLVLYPNADRVQVLWTYAHVHTLDDAIKNLAQREGTRKDQVGFLSTTDDTSNCQVIPEVLDEIRTWAVKKNLDAVVWTNLPFNFREKSGEEFNESNVIDYLRGLRKKEHQKARRYIEKTPLQIMTRIRRIIEQELGWEHADSHG